MSLFTKYLNCSIRRLGSLWETSIANECVKFYGVFDAENRLEVDGSGMNVLVAGSALQCETRIAKDFAYNQPLTDEHGTIWYAREVMKIDDGAISRVVLVEDPA